MSLLDIPRALRDFIFPTSCHLCGNHIETGQILCGICQVALPRTLYHTNPNNPMAMRFAGKFPFDRATGHFFYSSGAPISELMQDLKYRRFPSVGPFLGRLIADELFPSAFLQDLDYILPIPMHVLKKARRGYNQTELIAAGVSESTGIPVRHFLKASRPHRTQTALTIEQRMENLRNIFTLAEIPRSGARILLIDDVCTTGSTLTSAALTLLHAQPSLRLSLLTVGVTY